LHAFEQKARPFLAPLGQTSNAVPHCAHVSATFGRGFGPRDPIGIPQL
jgi:hypothetical protein